MSAATPARGATTPVDVATIDETSPRGPIVGAEDGLAEGQERAGSPSPASADERSARASEYINNLMPVSVTSAFAQIRDEIEQDTAAIADLTRRLMLAEFAAEQNATTIAAQAAEIRDLKSKLARVRPAIAQMFREADKVQIPTIIVRDYCVYCGSRFLVGKLTACAKCGGELQTHVKCPFDSPLSDLIDDEGISIEALGNLVADVALGVSHLELNDDGELVIGKVGP